MTLGAVSGQKKPNLILRTSLIIFLFLVGAKLLNFFKKILIGKLFGVSIVADAFFAASHFPYYAAIFFEGLIFLGILPLFTQAFKEKGAQEANQFLSQVLIVITFLTLSLALLAWWTAPFLIRQLVPGFTESEQGLTCSLFRIMTGVTVFLSLTSFFKALNSYYEHYAFAASSSMVDTFVMIGITLIGWKVGGIYAAAWAAVVGTFFAFISQAGFFIWKHSFFQWTTQTAWLQKFFSFLIPLAVIWAFQQVPLIIFNRFGSGMWEGTISSLNISQTLTTVPMGFVSHTVLLAIFPALAKQAAEATQENAKETFFKTLRAAFFILIPVGFLLSAFARPLTVIFFNGAGISPQGTQRIANALVCFGWATFALYADLFMTQALIAVRKTLPAIFLCAIRAGLTYLLSYIFVPLWDYQGLALAFSIALVVNLFIFFPLFFRMSSFMGRWKELLNYSAKLMLASSPMVLAGWLMNRWEVWQWIQFSLGQAVAVVTLGSAAALGMYFCFLWVLKVKEIRSIFENLKQSWIQKGWSFIDSES